MTLTRAVQHAGSSDIGFPPFQYLSWTVPDVQTVPLRFQTIRHLRELETLRSIWQCWPGTRDSDLDFFSSAVQTRGSGCEPHVIVLCRNAQPEAILVGRRERKR